MKALILIAALATVAHAEDKPAAQRYFTAGAKAYAAQNFAAAIASFEEAYKNYPIPEIAFSAAQAYRRQYRVDNKPEYVKRAVELYAAYLDKVKTGGRVGDAADSLGEMQRELDRLQASGAKIAGVKIVERTRLGVTIAGDQASLHEIGDAMGTNDAKITATLDGKPIEPFSLVDVEPGEHTFHVVADGFEPVDKSYRAVPGASELVEVALVAKSAKLTITTEADTRVVIDGRPRGTMPTGVLELVAGKHVVALLRSGREPIARELTVTRGEQVALTIPLDKTAKRRAVPWVLAGAGLAGAIAITSGIVALVADGTASDLHDGFLAGNRPASEVDDYDRSVRTRDRAVTATWVFGGAAVLATAVGLGLYLFDSPSGEGVTVAPAIGPAMSGAAVSGHW